MAEQEQNRSEEATPFKLEQARKRGTVAKSPDMVTAGMLLVVVVYLYWLGWSTAKGELKLAQTALAQAGRLDFSPAATLGFVGRLLTESVHALVPFLLALVIGAIVSNLAQTGPVFSLKPLSPDFSRINPAEGFKRFLSMRILYTAVKSLFKLLLLGCVFAMALHSMLSPLLGLLGADPVGYAPKLLDLAASLAGKLALVIFALALIDVVYVHREFAKKMLKRSRALKKLPSADVLVTNPTHIAVAISYKHGEMHAPRLVAKGAGGLAQKMREVASRHRVPVVQHPALARALFHRVDYDQFVPEEFYPQVLKILVWVYAMREARAAGSPA